MPRYTERAKLIRSLTRLQRLLALAQSDGDDAAGQDLIDVDDGLDGVQSSRYLRRARKQRRKNHGQAQKCANFLALEDVEFRRFFRVSHAEFEELCRLIKPDSFFTAALRQSPVEHQLLLVLWRLAHCGSGASVPEVAQKFGDSGT
ncbi:hypothetical protein CF319_g7838 [Tilletia indica]|nr:hypothetical protein CF319_g7838 [Tilletia indica]